ncbi:LytR C-terminal domain-containing protein, partial [Patescibacteria group bacterium]|nr:LytR C-terminal domain-containing protein [Patescibacteria group bacterium]
MADNPFIDPSFSYNKPEKRLSSRVAILIAGIVLVVLLLFGISKYLSSKPEKTVSGSVSSTTTTQTVEPTLTATPSPTLKPGKITPTPTKASSSSIDKVTGLDRAKLTVAIENGSGVVGAAGKASTLLTGLGYKVASTGNADKYTYVNVTIQVKTSSSKY